jgi:hypothetical protein
MGTPKLTLTVEAASEAKTPILADAYAVTMLALRTLVCPQGAVTSR